MGTMCRFLEEEDPCSLWSTEDVLKHETNEGSLNIQVVQPKQRTYMCEAFAERDEPVLARRIREWVRHYKDTIMK